MKKVLAILLFSFFSIGAVQAQQTPQYLFDLGNTKLSEKEYEAAKSEYLSILESGAETGGLFINLGFL